jgi:hypothetical protein
MANGEGTFELNGDLIHFEITEWTGEAELPPANDPPLKELTDFTATILILPTGCAELN